MNLKRIREENLLFFIPTLIFLLFGTILIFLTSKAELHLHINQFVNPRLNFFFKYITYLGDGLTIVVVAVLLLLFRSVKQGLTLGAIAAVIGIVVQFLKKVVFSDVFRPKKYFSETLNLPDVLNFIDGAEPAANFSFPSGHTATAFGLFLYLAFISKSKILKVIYFLIALLTAFSRVYLSWHFFEDILAGTVVGVSVTVLIYLFFEDILGKRLNLALFFRQKKRTS